MTRLCALVVGIAMCSACGSSVNAPTPTPTPSIQAIGPAPTPPPTAAPSPAPTRFTVSGTVTDGTSHGVLPNVVVAINGGAQSAMTDGSGRYVLASVPIGTVTATAAAVSYVTASQNITVKADLTVDFILQRVPDSRPSTPAPTPPPGLTTDTISVPHDFIIGTPIATNNQAAMYNNVWPVPVRNNGSYTYDLSQFPADQLPSGGSSNMVSSSEMLMIGIRYGATATRQTTFTWYRADNDLSFTTLHAGIGNISYVFIGHFDWEIATPGRYYVIIDSEFGSARIDYSISRSSALGR